MNLSPSSVRARGQGTALRVGGRHLDDRPAAALVRAVEPEGRVISDCPPGEGGVKNRTHS